MYREPYGEYAYCKRLRKIFSTMSKVIQACSGDALLRSGQDNSHQFLNQSDNSHQSLNQSDNSHQSLNQLDEKL